MLNKMPMALSDEMHYALDQLEHSSQHIFISGRAGTGKSTLLQVFRSTSHKRIAVVAPTGVAALNVKGQTIHSFFRFPPRLISNHEIRRQKNCRLYENLEILVIDEISMVRADLFDNIDYFLRINRKIDAPFGGVRLVFFGDMFQLPPVVASDFEKKYLYERYTSPYFFSSSAFNWIQDNLEYIELGTVYRQNERYFIRILDNIRRNLIDEEDLLELNQRIKSYDERFENSITLTTRNDKVGRINASELSKLHGPPMQYTGRVSGNFDARIYPTNFVLELKEGAQVMLLRNDPQKRFVNGSIGKIITLRHDGIKVVIMDGPEEQEVDLEKNIWEMIKYQWDEAKKKVDPIVTGIFEQYPLKLAWAVTIHKSQGKSFDKVYIDMGSGAFEYGQTYVALSRCTSLDGLQLNKALKNSDILVDERIAEFYNRWR